MITIELCNTKEVQMEHHHSSSQQQQLQQRWNVLVFGGTEFMGRHLVQSLLDRGHQVTIANRGNKYWGVRFMSIFVFTFGLSIMAS
jgi:hypothetical protein